MFRLRRLHVRPAAHAIARRRLPHRRLSYFFLLPNVCFPLFPVVDYRRFCRTTTTSDRHRRSTRSACEWIFRGVVHLILYRMRSTSSWCINPADGRERRATCCTTCLWLFLLYLRVSGQFHIIVGMLHLFGFNLAETHHAVLPGVELHGLLAADQHLLEGLHDEDLLLSGVFRAPEAGETTWRWSCSTIARVRRDLGAARRAVVLAAGLVPARAGTMCCSGRSWPCWWSSIPSTSGSSDGSDR